MEKSAILEKLKEIIHEQLGSEVDNVTEATTLAEDLQADSLDKVEMIMAAEDEFGIEIDDDSAMAFETVGNVVDYVAAKV